MELYFIYYMRSNNDIELNNTISIEGINLNNIFKINLQSPKTILLWLRLPKGIFVLSINTQITQIIAKSCDL